MKFKNKIKIYVFQPLICGLHKLGFSYENLSNISFFVKSNLISQAKQLAKKKGLEYYVSFQVADALKLPFPNNEFDVAVSQAMWGPSTAGMS